MISRLQYLQNKIVDHDTALKRINMWKMKSSSSVFTNGCFDILHEGHITYLAEAAELGDKLIVGLNTDASVKRLGKGDGRPINSEASRAVVLASLGYVDLVVLFDEDTPEEIIRMLNPDILVKGADYNPKETNKSSKEYIVGSDYIKEQGGQVVAIPLVDGFSTTALIEKLRG